MTETAGLTTLCNPAGGAEPQSTPDERAAAASSLDADRTYHAEAVRQHRARKSRRLANFTKMRARDRKRHVAMEKMTERMRRALVVFLEDGELVFGRHYWSGKSGRKVEFKTVIAMYDRYYIKVVIDQRAKGCQIAVLTEPGERIARDLKREKDEDESGRAASEVSEDAHLFAGAIA